MLTFSCLSGRVQKLQEKRNKINCLPPILLHGNAPTDEVKAFPAPTGAGASLCEGLCYSRCANRSLTVSQRRRSLRTLKIEPEWKLQSQNVSLEPCEGRTETWRNRKRRPKHWRISGKAWDQLLSAEAFWTNKHDKPAKKTFPDIKTPQNVCRDSGSQCWRPNPGWIYMDALCSHREHEARCVTLNSATTHTLTVGEYLWTLNLIPNNQISLLASISRADYWL